MANTSLSRNPFADPTLPTFADLIARVSAEETLPLRTRQNCTPRHRPTVPTRIDSS